MTKIEVYKDYYRINSESNSSKIKLEKELSKHTPRQALSILNETIEAVKKGALIDYKTQVDEVYGGFNKKVGLFGRAINWIKGIFVETYVGRVDKAYQEIMKMYDTKEKNLEKLENGLNAWVNNKKIKGEKEEAKTRILNAFKNSLKNLDLKDLGLTSLPEGIGLLSHLERLELGINELGKNTLMARSYFNESNVSMVKSLEKLTNLKYLDLANNGFKEMPEDIGKLKSLETIIWTFEDAGDLRTQVLSAKVLNLSKKENNKNFHKLFGRISKEKGRVIDLKNKDPSNTDQTERDSSPIFPFSP